ncbi:hypothetical protein SAMN05660464_1171 [Geodermatophilus dictyosporus]|uniref:CAAX prenyl protease 2/Lysostaphin resistance protein A-like domain-containing protein n=1 Tax=Geodermatophilus dictyosporus TaxID=1523247 RepID=A0A1I5K1C6_9ACTN|nr:SRPBCC family protein [Geodermatophilus dictyosporus]SFO78431.1 hypothetical protein SAMN05660464_1171 [Geodermatophilus dictyosporus]
MTPVRAPAREHRLVGVVRQHPVASFLAWSFPVGQVIAFQPVVARAWYDVDLPTAPFVVLANLVGLLLPAVVVTRVVDGRAGVRALWCRAARVRVPPRWYGLALVVVPVASAATAVALLGPPDSGRVLAAAVVAGLVLQLLLGFLTTNWAEEVAWTGFLQTRLQHRHGPVRAALATGPLFALQHASLAVGNGWLGGITVLLFVTATAVPFRFLQGWVANRTGSLLVVGLVHAAGNATTDGSGFGGPGLLPRLYAGEAVGPVHLLASAALGLVVVAATRGRLGDVRPPAPPTPGSATGRAVAARAASPRERPERDRTSRSAGGDRLPPAPTPTPPEEKSMSKELSAEVDIRATPERVWEVLTDLAAYPAWNPFIVAAEGVVAPGRRLTLRMQPVGGRAMTLRPRLVEVAAGRALRWRGRLVVPGLVDAEHGFVLRPQAGGTRLVQEETFRGVLVPLVAASLDRGTRPAFVAMNEALKRRAEEPARTRAGTGQGTP